MNATPSRIDFVCQAARADPETGDLPSGGGGVMYQVFRNKNQIQILSKEHELQNQSK